MTIQVQIENPVDARIRLKARKTLDGNILILDHPEIDIVLSPKNKKVFALSKHQYGDHVYATQSRFFDHLSKKGVVDPSSVHGGNVFGSLEGVILESVEPQKVDPIQMTLYSVAGFLMNEAPHFDAVKRYEMDFEKELLEPDAADSTTLGQVPHKKRKGTMTQYAGINTAYGLYGMYEE
jgi:hypothetical protein